MMQNILQQPETMSITDVLRNSTEEILNLQGPESPETTASTDTSYRTSQSIPPSSESIAIPSQSLETPIDASLQEEYQQIRPGPKSVKRRRALDLVQQNSSQEFRVPSQPDAPDAGDFINKVKKLTEKPKKKRKKTQSSRISSSGSLSSAPPSSELNSIVEVTISSIAQPQSNLLSTSSDSPLVAPSTSRIVLNPVDQAILDSAHVDSSSSSSTSSRSLPTNVHSNGAAPRRVNFHLPRPTSGATAGRDNRGIHVKNFGG